jgi:hypothetical protein
MSHLPWIGGQAPCYPPFLQVVGLRSRCRYVLSWAHAALRRQHLVGLAGATSRPTPALNSRWVSAPMASHLSGLQFHGHGIAPLWVVERTRPGALQNQRRHSTIDYLTPVDYEHQHSSPAPAA